MELSAVDEVLCCVQLAAMYGRSIRVQLHFGQQFIGRKCALRPLSNTKQRWGSGQNVHSETQHTAPTVTVRFTHRYILLSENIAVSPVRKRTLPRLAF